MCRHPLLVMSLSGSIVVALYGLFGPIIKRYVSIPWQRAILEVAVFFYLFPLPLFKKGFVVFIFNLFPALVGPNEPETKILDLSYVINQQPGDTYYGPQVLLIVALVCCMGVIASFVMIWQIKQYLALSRLYRSTALSENPPSDLIGEFEQIKKDLKIRGNVNFICSPFCKTPMTIGILSPTIVFPTSGAFCLEPICYTYILKHELLHIKNRDFLVKMLSFAVLALHWYNPVCYFLYREICTVCEMNCDHEIVKEADETVRRAYSSLLLDLATENQAGKGKYAMGLVNGGAAAFEKRILEMKTSRKHKSFLSCAILIAVCLVGSVAAFAYEPPLKYKIEGFDPNGGHVFAFSSEKKEIASFPYDLFFADKEGNIYPVDMIISQSDCKHRLVEGTCSHHLKDSSGGCITVAREAWRCSVCGQMESDGMLSRTMYTICPH